MQRIHLAFLMVILSAMSGLAQGPGGGGGGRGNMSDEERAARRAEFEAMSPEERSARFAQMRAGGGGPPQRNVDAAVASSATGPGEELATENTAKNTGSDVVVNWENITLKDCIEVLSRDLDMEFIISPSVNVAQEVSVRAGDVTRWAKPDKLELFDAILETAGVQKVQRGRVWIFSPSDIRPVIDSYKDEKYSDGKPIIGVIRLKHIDSSKAEPFMNTVGGKAQKVFAMKGTRMVLVLGTQQYLTQMQELAALIDFPPGIMVPYVIKNAASDDIVEEMTSIFYGRSGGDGEAIRFVSVSRLNTVVVHNVPESMTEEIEHWINLLDRTESENERVTKVYRLQVIESETMGETLDNLYSSLYQQMQAQEQTSAKNSNNTKAKKTTATAKNSGAKTSNAKKTPTKTTTKSSSGNVGGGGAPGASPEMNEEAIILSDKDTNTLIINATPDQHRDIERTIRELDQSRRQVLIETVLMEVTLDDSTDLGIEWAVTSGKNSYGLQSGFTPGVDDASYPFAGVDSGLSYLFDDDGEKMAFISAAEEDNRLEVLASPTVLTRDGMEATVSFGEEVPIQEKTSTDSGKESFSYDYRDAKITLTVTPVIDDNKMVTLTLEQTVRQVDPAYTGDADTAPIFTTRELSSNLQVENGQTLILGGLIQRQDQEIRQGIPLLCRLPLIGWMFGHTQTIKVGSEIMMILTPHVVDGREETDILTEQFRNKILGSMSVDDVRSLYPAEDEETETETEGE